jgi:DNA-binding MarR family transcriptional regulator
MVEANRRLENLTGALSVVLTDRINATAEEIVGMGGEAPAAIVQIGTMPNLTITMLGLALGLTHSATVRVVAKLEKARFVKKSRGEDAREVYVSLTPQGEKIMRKTLAARDAILAKCLRPLSDEQREALEGILDLVLRNAPSDEDDAVRICRMCDERCCPQDRCPVTTYD